MLECKQAYICIYWAWHAYVHIYNYALLIIVYVGVMAQEWRYTYSCLIKNTHAFTLIIRNVDSSISYLL